MRWAFHNGGNRKSFVKPTRPSFLTMELTKWPCHHWDLRRDLAAHCLRARRRLLQRLRTIFRRCRKKGNQPPCPVVTTIPAKSPRPPSKPVKPPPAAGDGEGGPQIDPVCQFDLRNCYRSTGGYISGFCLWNWLTCKLLFWRHRITSCSLSHRSLLSLLCSIPSNSVFRTGSTEFFSMNGTITSKHC